MQHKALSLKHSADGSEGLLMQTFLGQLKHGSDHSPGDMAPPQPHKKAPPRGMKCHCHNHQTEPGYERVLLPWVKWVPIFSFAPSPLHITGC